MLRSKEKGSYFVSNAGLTILPEAAKKVEASSALSPEIMVIIENTAQKTEKTVMVTEELVNKLEDAQTETEVRLSVRGILDHYEIHSPFDKRNVFLRALKALDNHGVPTVKEYKKLVLEIVNRLG